MYLLLLLLPFLAHAEECSQMEAWDNGMAMCMPRAMSGMPMKMLMLSGHSFAVQSWESGPRGRTDFGAPNMFMADLGSSLGDRHYLNLDFMGTFEKWTFPSAGYPELLQIGESQANGQPFLDAQHPHSTPIMGLTLSDTISVGSGHDNVKLRFAPRGESSDGPVAFMHRPTGEVNPDAPLGHHIGQDVGHISSTVIGASASLGENTFEASTFHGEEPKPTRVDLPLGTPDSYAARFTHHFGEDLYAMASVAFVQKPDPDVDHVWRYSASAYLDSTWGDWKFSNALIYGYIQNYDHANALSSFAEEALLRAERDAFWSRLEVLQRTPEELLISSSHDPRWVAALTLGYTRTLAELGELELGLGGSGTVDFLPAAFRGSYGTPVTGRVFLTLSGMKMWEL